jgi:DNA-binding NtrC family response regulator
MVRTPALLIEALAHESFDGVLIDLNYTRDTTSGQEGMDLVARIKEIDPQLPVVVMTAWGNIDLAVEAMRRGASDFIQKPWENPRLLSILRTQMELHRSQRRTQWLEAENRILRAPGAPDFIATAESMRQVLETMSRVGPSDANVLITGEHGTGKEVVAQTAASALGARLANLVAVNTGALPEGTFESELFGHVKGAFTDARTDRIGRFELANGGTLFLDEIANIPIRQQAKILRVLETGELERVGSSRTQQVDVRIVSATNANLRQDCAEGRFREDLLFRLNTVEICLPPLARTEAKISPLWPAIFSLVTPRAIAAPFKAWSRPRCRLMLQYAWPGNVRELDHTIERAVLMARGERIDARSRPACAARRAHHGRHEPRSGRSHSHSQGPGARPEATSAKPRRRSVSAAERSTGASKNMAYNDPTASAPRISDPMRVNRSRAQTPAAGPFAPALSFERGCASGSI